MPRRLKPALVIALMFLPGVLLALGVPLPFAAALGGVIALGFFAAGR